MLVVLVTFLRFILLCCVLYEHLQTSDMLYTADFDQLKSLGLDANR